MAYISFEEPDNREFALNDPRGFPARFPDGAILDEIQRVPDLVSYIQTKVMLWILQENTFLRAVKT